MLKPYTNSAVAVADGKLEELYSAIPFPDKERWSPYQHSMNVCSLRTGHVNVNDNSKLGIISTVTALLLVRVGPQQNYLFI